MERAVQGAEPSLDDLRELYRTRMLLEPELAARAATRFTEEDATEARGWLERLAVASEQGDVAAASTATAGFHDTLVRAARSPWLERLVGEPFEAGQRYLRTLAPDATARHLRASQREQRAILAACDAHDERGARRYVHDHLAATADRIAAGMGGAPLFGLRADRTLSGPASFSPAEQGFAPVRPGVEGATIETGDLTVTTYRYRPGTVWQEHAHPEDQLTMVLTGAGLRFSVGGREMTLRPGEVLLIPGGTPHSAVVGDAEVLTLNVWRLRSAPPA